ncbi:hypothetical protein ACT3TC_16915 [Halomonas sp. AOP27-A1-41]|uniref:hypothetical protein n=1 Tax=Halomonas sp. AOP27-A1-41 TaxID=3457707 RepID=UPI0040332F2F
MASISDRSQSSLHPAIAGSTPTRYAVCSVAHSAIEQTAYPTTEGRQRDSDRALWAGGEVASDS